MSNSYRQERYVIMTLDPVHVGTGGNRLGRVDLSIVREPGTRLPKIPGTTLHGAIRQYAAICYDDLSTAGGGKNQNDRHPVNYTFGSIKEAGGNGGQSGQVSINDARLLLFPVHSLAGPVWVTCPGILREFGVDKEAPITEKNGAKIQMVALSSDLQAHTHLNLGWLMLPKTEDTFCWPEEINHVPPEINSCTALVSDKLFSQIVNSNLEVRTSVSIDPVTGAAADKALFTYEAIPRATILWLDVVEDDFRGTFPADHTKAQELGHTKPLDVVTAGLKLAEMLGIGGMGTRGFGRIRLLKGGDVK
ncbi:MAG: type III-B CRISPR module RAMP protein Cmr4 [Chloroflexi bacterium]|nr:MAG: type III-B CRISPR module RAMP protein Cmr4 [Chloroflexota bacterium]